MSVMFCAFVVYECGFVKKVSKNVFFVSIGPECVGYDVFGSLQSHSIVDICLSYLNRDNIYLK